MDLKDIERILELMRKHDLVEVELEDSEKGTRIRLSKSAPDRGGHPVLAPTLALPAAMEAPRTAVPSANPGTTEAAPDATADERKHLVEVPSPMVGTFYRATSPDSDPFVDVGDRIDEETVVCIIEAMKVMNEIKAEVAGEVVEILVQNGEAVEFGQPLFLIRTE